MVERPGWIEAIRADNRRMRVRFTKMQGAGNDFVVLDAVQDPALASLATDTLKRIADRHFGVGADQILLVQPPSAHQASDGIQFGYRIFNGASGDEVEHCGNGARCFVRYVREAGLTDRQQVRVATVNRVLELREEADGRATVGMGMPWLSPSSLPFDPEGLAMRRPADALAGYGLWPIEADGRSVDGAVVSMGNPHLVLMPSGWGPSTSDDPTAPPTDLDVDRAPVATLGPLLERHRRFPNRVNVGFVQLVSRRLIRLRVHERDAGETLACGTGACAAVVAGIALGLLDEQVDVATRGGLLRIAWHGRTEGTEAPVWMTGPAETVFQGEMTL
jgi:diaminopimelate epimerase